MDIKGTMRKYGYTMEQLAVKINGSQSSLSQVMSNPSPTLKMLDRIAEGLGCKRWEFFLDEMDREEVMAKLGITIPQAPQQQADGLPFGNDTQGTGTALTSQPSQTKPVPDVSHAVAASLICPHCGAAFVVEVKQV
jgi:transcriptional regulator with XRE-family HTH domain